ncbi:MAG TPA: hypothetical protein VMQ76_04945 [Terracidiphilus sp.]|nr:hypothetical protein [Terracidiphilus sp.]
MHDDISNACFCVCDHGFFVPLALRLAETGARVIYHNLAWAKSNPTLSDGIIGDGFENIECVLDLWDIKKEVDAFVFPDVGHMGLQKELASQGFPVWGAKDGMRLETDREFFMKKLDELGLDVPPFQKVIGLTALAKYLIPRRDIWIKISRWRGSWETKHWRSYKEDGGKLDNWAVLFGGAKEMIIFLCFDKIETKLEIGSDTYNVDGQYPSLVLHGIEKKDEAYFSAITKRDKLPPEILTIMEAFQPWLKKKKYRNQWCMEIRVTEHEAYFLDATPRGGLPSTGSQLMAMSNLPEVILRGASGEFVEAEYNCKFTAECMVKIHGETNTWETLDIPRELRPYLMLSDCCEIKGQTWWPGGNDELEDLGWLVATGDTPTETLHLMNHLADLLPDGANACVEALADIIREVEEMEANGIPFTDEPMPEAEIVLEPATA